MRRFELAWITARNFAGKPPVFVALDDIQFRAPVSIGDVISFTASVEYSQGGYSCSLQPGILRRRVVLVCGRSSVYVVMLSGYPHRTMSVAVSTAILDPVAESTRITNDFHFTFRVDGVVNAVRERALSPVACARRHFYVHVHAGGSKHLRGCHAVHRSDAKAAAWSGPRRRTGAEQSRGRRASAEVLFTEPSHRRVSRFVGARQSACHLCVGVVVCDRCCVDSVSQVLIGQPLDSYKL